MKIPISPDLPHSERHPRRRPAAATFTQHLGAVVVATLALTGVGMAQVSAANATSEVDPAPSVSAPTNENEDASSGAAARAADAAPAVVTTTTASLLPNSITYGQSIFFTATVALDGPSMLMGAPIQLEVDGVVGGSGALIYIGSGKFWALIPAQNTLSAGTHQLVAKFPAYSSKFPFAVNAAGSQSAPITLTVAQAPTTTTITSSPASVVAFTPVDVAAKVTAKPEGLSGSAALLADDDVIAIEELAADGTVQFEDAIVPFGTAGLSVSYLGDDAGNFAASASNEAPIEVLEVATETAIALSDSHVRAGDPVTFVATVRNVSEENLVDPRSGIEILVDGEVVYTEVSADEGDATPGDGTTQFQVTLSDTLLGTHAVTANFLPATGFTASQSASAELQVDGVETTLSSTEGELRGTPKHPANVTVNASKTSAPDPVVTRLAEPTGDDALPAETDEPTDGYVQAFLGDKPVGDPILVEDGTGTGPLAGLPVGSHQVELRFTPGNYGYFRSSTTVSVTVTADAIPSGGGSKPAPAAGLSATGDDLLPTIALTALGLMVSAGLLLTLARRRKA